MGDDEASSQLVDAVDDALGAESVVAGCHQSDQITERSYSGFFQVRN